MIGLEAWLDSSTEQDGIGAFVLQVLLREDSHQSVVVVIVTNMYESLAKPYSQEVLIADVEAHTVLEALGEFIEAFKLGEGHCWLDLTNDVSATRGAKVINQLAADVGNYVAYIFLLFLPV